MPSRFLLAKVRVAWRTLPLLCCAAVLALVTACAPDATTAPRAAAGALRRLIVPGPTYTQVDAGVNHTCALTTAGAISCWGVASGGYSAVTQAPAGTGYTQVSGGWGYSCALTAAGAISCWGGNDYGALNGIPTGTGYKQIGAGYEHACAVTGGGAITCWGNTSGGVGTPPPGTGYQQVTSGYGHSCALTSAGALACWGGLNFTGELNAPRGAGYTQVSAGAHHNCALTSGGAITCWGANFDGELNNIPAGSGHRQVSGGGTHTCALTAVGAIACWGNNDYGQLNAPAGTGYTQIDAGDRHTCAVTAAGTIACWGTVSDGGQLNPPVSHVLPTATFTAPASVVVGQPVALALGNARVPGYPAATTFTYAFDCGTGAYAPASGTATASCPTTAAGPLTVRGKVIDQDGDTAAYSATVTVTLAAQTVAFTSAAPSPAYVGTSYAASASATSGLAVTLTSLTPATCAVAGTTVSFIAAGPCTLAADQAGNATYAAAARATQTVPVSRRPQAFTLTTVLPASAVVTSTFALGATPGASGTPVLFASQTPAACTTTTGPTGTTLTLTGAGTCAVQATEAGTATYADAPAQTLTMTVLTPAQATSQLRAAVAAANLGGPADGLLAKLDAALQSLAQGQAPAACDPLGAFQNQLRAQRGRAVPAAAADAWLAQAGQIRTALGC